MLKNLLDNRYDYWIYPLYIVVACIFTAGLNIIHTKYVLQIDPNPRLFVVPTIAGIIFGYLTARIRLSQFKIADSGDWKIFLKYIAFACIVTFGLNVAHTEWILNRRLETELFLAPLIAGVFFGYLLARIKTLNNKLLRLATTDMLTQLCNRMQFDNFLRSEIEKVKRYGGTFSVIYFDLDNFKFINDKYGHQTGDRLLASLAAYIGKINRKSDILARYGGDEFIILAPSTNAESAHRQAEILKQAINDFHFDDIEDSKVSCSFGVVEFNQNVHSNHSIVNAVDEALYRAKNMGRNCVVAA